MSNRVELKENKTAFTRLEFRVTAILGIAWVCYVAVLLLGFPPYWALMDDHSHLMSLPHFQKVGFLGWMREFIEGDFGWGMFRPVYGAYIYLFYGWFGRFSSVYAYSFLYLVDVAIFGLWGWVFARCLSNRSCPLVRRDRATWGLLFVILCFHFIRNNNLFYFASLQERAVILFVGLAMHGMLYVDGLSSRKTKQALTILTSFLCCSLALLAKATAVSFVPLFALWWAIRSLRQPKAKWISWLGAAFFLSLAVGASLYFSSIRGGYTSGYRFTTATQHMSDLGSKFYKITGFSMLAAALALLGWVRRKERDPELLYRSLIWPMGMMAYMLIMLPWQGFLNYYLIIPVGMFWVGAKLIVFREAIFWLKKWKTLPYTLVFIGIVAITSINPMRKFYQKAVHHHGTGKALDYLRKRLDAEGDSLDVRMAENCEETSSALGNFLDRRIRIPMARKDDPFYKTSPVEGVSKLLVTHRECPKFPNSYAPYTDVFSYGEWHIYEQGHR